MGDSVVAVDRGRLSVVDKTGALVRSAEIQRLDSINHAATARKLAVSGIPQVEGGTQQGLLIVSYSIAGGPREDGPYRNSKFYSLVSSDGEYRLPLGIYPGSESAQITSRGITPDGVAFDATIHTELPIGRNTVVAANTHHIAIADQARLAVDYYEPNGMLAAILRVESPPQLLDRGRFAASQGNSCPTGACWQDASLPDTLPSFDQLLLDPGGNLWVQEFVPEYDEREPQWLIFDKDGNIVAEAVMPTGFVPHQAGRNWLLGLTTDELGLQYVELWSIVKTGADQGLAAAR